MVLVIMKAAARLLVLLGCLVLCRADAPTPLVMWHGMGDSCCNPLSLGNIAKLIQSQVPGIYIHSIEIGNNIIEDTLNGFFKNVNDQIDMACKIVAADTNLTNGFHAIGFSQGGQFLRALVQKCPQAKVLNLISVGGQHQGVFGFPRCPGGNETICEIVRRLLNLGAYQSVIQDFLVQAEYWQDPMDEAEYRSKCVFLPDINQENHMNSSYKDRLSKLAQLVLVMFTQDTMVQPKESEWFGFYKEGQDKETYSLFESKLYTDDLLGLKQLNDTNRLHFLEAPFDHLQFTEEWFIQNLIPYIK